MSDKPDTTDAGERAALNALVNLSGDVLFDKISPEEIRQVAQKAAAYWRIRIVMPPEMLAVVATLRHLKQSIDYRLNDRLCEMKPDYDDSMTGFNEAWDIVREVFKEATEALQENTSGKQP